MTAICPEGHVSTTDDYCDQCGARIGAARARSAAGQETELLPALTSVAVRTRVDLEPCPHCGAARAEADRFCEDCGHDFSGRDGASEPDAHAGFWTVVVTVDHERFERAVLDGIDPPADFAPPTILLKEAEVKLGRIEVGGDPAVSRTHLVLVRQSDGTYAVVDDGSANGTVVNESPSPIPPRIPVRLGPGHRVQIGAWTTLTLLPPSDIATRSCTPASRSVGSGASPPVCADAAEEDGAGLGGVGA